MAIYTRTGDSGETDLRAGMRVAKHTPRIEAIGTLDELVAVLGMVRAQRPVSEVERLVDRVQNELLALGAELAHPEVAPPAARRIRREHIAALETDIDRYEPTLPELRQFLVPAGASTAAALHWARCVCRRAERRLVALRHHDPQSVPAEWLAYLNRLSDLLFVLARAENQATGHGDQLWRNLPPARPGDAVPPGTP